MALRSAATNLDLSQVLSWLQPELTEGFLKAAFHASTQKSQPELIAQERKYSNANPPYMFKAFHRQVWHRPLSLPPSSPSRHLPSGKQLPKGP